MSGKDIRETLGLLAVVAGLVFVGLEIRQNTQAVRATTTQNISDQNVSLALTTMSSPIPDILARVEGGLPLDELEPGSSRRLDYFYQANLRVTENRFRQIELGAIEPVALEQLGATGSIYRTPVFREWWAANAVRFASDFAAFMDDQYGLR